MGDVAVRFEEIWKAFDGRPVLRGLDLEVPRGTTLTVMGGSGSGKTVTLRLAVGLIKPDRGRITVLEVESTPLREEELLPLRRRTGFVFQGAALFDSLTAYENVAYPLREHAQLPEARAPRPELIRSNPERRVTGPARAVDRKVTGLERGRGLEQEQHRRRSHLQEDVSRIVAHQNGQPQHARVERLEGLQVLSIQGRLDDRLERGRSGHGSLAFLDGLASS